MSIQASCVSYASAATSVKLPRSLLVSRAAAVKSFLPWMVIYRMIQRRSPTSLPSSTKATVSSLGGNFHASIPLQKHFPLASLTPWPVPRPAFTFPPPTTPPHPIAPSVYGLPPSTALANFLAFFHLYPQR